MFIYLQKCHCIFDNVVFAFNCLYAQTLKTDFLLVSLFEIIYYTPCFMKNQSKRAELYPSKQESIVFSFLLSLQEEN